MVKIVAHSRVAVKPSAKANESFDRIEDAEIDSLENIGIVETHIMSASSAWAQLLAASVVLIGLSQGFFTFSQDFFDHQVSGPSEHLVAAGVGARRCCGWNVFVT